ncbi:hypothetical protein D9619_004709 [Psilocybe cf. subviscida]|uniref:Uncharacterized protein n=1 Tax=Psilocybe cf. subviscida TaxID=2480587 RepID=A0A8H5BQH7_9AGAR|nr:hypothetical protein D9619_004709 [Psilocybe cf. subviscida]
MTLLSGTRECDLGPEHGLWWMSNKLTAIVIHPFACFRYKTRTWFRCWFSFPTLTGSLRSPFFTQMGPYYSRKKHPYGFTHDDFKIQNLSNIFKLQKKPKAHQAAVDNLKALQAERMDLELTSTEQPQALDEAVSQFKGTFPSLFLVEPEKREYAVKHFLMTLHQAARSSARTGKKGKGKGSSSQASHTSTASAMVTRSAEDNLVSGHGSVMELTENEEDGDDDELDQLSVFDRTSPSLDYNRAKTEESTYVASAIASLGRQNRPRVIRKPLAPLFGSRKGWAPPISQTLAKPSPTPIVRPQHIAFQPPPPTQIPVMGTSVSQKVGNQVTISISMGAHGANTPAEPTTETGANFIYEFLSTCQPPLTTLLPKFMKRGCGSQYFMRGISTWDVASRRALLEAIVMEPVDDGNVYAGQKLPPIMVDILEHQFTKYFLQHQPA